MAQTAEDDALIERRRRHRRQRLIAVAVILLLAAGVAALRIFNHLERETLKTASTYVPKPTEFTPELELLRQYVRIDSSNPPGDETATAAWLVSVLRQHGVQPEVIESAPKRMNVYARIRGRRPAEGLLLLNHMDVWPADPAGWTRPPFSADLYLNQIYGRGSIDMKATAICELRAFLDVAESGRQPERDLVFLAVADEETGSNLGMRWLVEHRPDVIEGIRYAVNEGGITEMIDEKVTYFGIETGTKQPARVVLKAPRRDQLLQARIAIEPHIIKREPDRIMPEVRRFFADLAPHRKDFRKELSDINAAAANGEFWALPVGYREITQNNTWAEGAFPDGREWQMVTVMLNLPDENPDARIEWLRRFVAPYGVRVATVVEKEGPAPITSDRTPFYALLAREARAMYGSDVGVEILNRSWNDSRFLRGRGIAAYGLSPLPVDFFQADTIHGIDERIRVDYFNQGVAYMRRVVQAYAYGDI